MGGPSPVVVMKFTNLASDTADHYEHIVAKFSALLDT